MNFSQMMLKIERGKLAKRPSWGDGIAITMAEAEFVVFIGLEDPTDEEEYTTYELDREDFYATDWIIL